MQKKEIKKLRRLWELNNYNRVLKQHRMMTRSILVALMVLLSLSTVYAHRMMIDPVEDTTIWVGYEDGDTIENITVQVLDEEGEILAEEKADQDGYYSFEDEPDAHSIVADDGMGHQVTWVIGEPAAYREGWIKYIRIVGVVTVFALVALFFRNRSRKVKKDSESGALTRDPRAKIKDSKTTPDQRSY